MLLDKFASYVPKIVEKDAIAWEPREGPQKKAFETTADITFFGGKAGSGKTDLLLGLSLLQHEKSIIFRRVFPQLGGIIRRSKEIIKKTDNYNESKHIWTLNENSFLEFGSCQYEKDAEKYMGHPHDFIGIDEITHFPIQIMQFLTGWNRTTTEGQRCRIVFTGNPPTSRTGRWVIKYFAPWLDPSYTRRSGKPKAEDGELRWFITNLEGEEEEVDGPEIIIRENENGEPERLTPNSRTFIAGQMLEELIKTGYRARLQSLPEPLRSILLKGDFQTSVIDDPWQLIPTAWVDLAVARWNSQAPFRQTHLGVDVSRGGADETIIISRHSNWIAPIIAYEGQLIPDGDVAANHVIKELQDRKTSIRIDALGVGTSPYDTLKRQKYDVEGLIASQGSDKTDKSGKLGFANKRAEWWWNLRELFDPKGNIPIAIPNDEKLIEELTLIRWHVAHRSKGELGVILIESKEELAKPERLGRSPDRGDALCYAFADVEKKTNVSDFAAFLGS